MVRTQFGFHIIPGECGEFKLANMTWGQKQRFFKHIQAISVKYDLIIFDLGAGITRNVIDFALMADDSCIVTTPSDIISGYAAAKAAFGRFVEINGKLGGSDAEISEFVYSPKFILNQVNNRRHGNSLFQSLKQTLATHVNQNAIFKITPDYLGSVISDRARLLDTYSKREIIGLKHPASELALNYHELASRYLGINSADSTIQIQRASGLRRFGRMLGLGAGKQ